MTRIVAGAAGGRRLAVPPRGTRPTSERVREALFNALEAAMELDGAAVLDLYAGSGALGLEARSRGAARVVCVESDRKAAEVLRRNVSSVGLGGVTVRAGKVRTVLQAGADEPFDVVIADPPYALETGELAAVLRDLAGGGWTRPGTTVVIEREKRDGEIDWPAPFQPVRTRTYGQTVLHWGLHEMGLARDGPTRAGGDVNPSRIG
ncbi:MAG: 16S rRNA (guanine(966)-N(2))-methyltransferase RsmD [Pseudonocardiaceae bacterium]|nr:16S rRNA (guanine(966)-N(2))-methyltransferase RsmD [Pseudonocardiaceae bacterium]